MRAGSPLRRINVAQARELQQHGAVMLDVRNPDEWRSGVAPGAVRVPLASLQAGGGSLPDSLPVDCSVPVMLICETSQRAQAAAVILQQQGYTNLAVVAGGMQAWREAGLSLETPSVDARELRYDRQLRLPQWGCQAQEKMAQAHVLMIGVGGLGSPAALYLAAAGIGRLTLLDDDVVEESNLQRQILHSTDAIGQPKVESARRRLQALNPYVDIHSVPSRLSAQNAAFLIEQADVVIDGSDNLATRYLVNRLCWQTSTPLVYAAVFQFEGQVASFDFRQPDSPCYACLFPPASDAEPANCAQAGVLGVVPGMAGTLQASEAIKLVTGVGQPLTGQLLTFDVLENRFRTLTLRKDPHCPVCAASPR